jgi:small subunit ribosomal protein S3
MGQKSNLITVRNPETFGLYTHNSKSWVALHLFFSNLNRLFLLKGALIFKNFVGFENNAVFITLYLFYQTKLISKYKQRLVKLKAELPILSKKRSSFLFKQYINFYGYNYYVLNIYKLNTVFKNNQGLRLIYSKFKKFLGPLFTRRSSIFYDFIKTFFLLKQNLIPSMCFTQILGLIFKSLSKRQHTRYISFIRDMLKLLIEKTPSFKNAVRGVKFLVSGRILGKQRSSSRLVLVGQLPLQSINKRIEVSSLHIYTLYGVFGIKTWVYMEKQ